MKQLVKLISEKNYAEADRELADIIPNLLEQKFLEMKKSVAAKMHEQMGAIGPSRAEKLRSGVLEEDEIEEMDLSREKPDYSRIEDRRKERGVNSSIKTNLGGEQKVASGKGNLQGKQTVNTSEKGNLKEEESGEESSMARSELNAITKDAKSIMSKVKGNKELEAWTQSKITKAADYLNSVADYMDGEEELDEARINIVRARVRGGKIQRRKRVSNVPGMTLRGGTLKRMSAAERRRRKMGARKGKMKRKAKMTRTLMKRKRSLQKRKSLGL
jgi:hypothetical protein